MVSEQTLDRLRKSTSDWISQSQGEPSCLPCSLYNIVHEISSRDVAPLESAFSFEDVSKYLGYNPITGTSWDSLDAAMRKMIRLSRTNLWSPHVEETVRSTDGRTLCDKASDERCSFPLVTLGGEYLRDVYGLELPDNPMLWLSHTVVVLGCEGDDSIIYDPYAMSRGAEPVRVLPMDELKRYWSLANVPRGHAWFQRQGRVLEEYQGAERCLRDLAGRGSSDSTATRWISGP